jgi:hypothetical protein
MATTMEGKGREKADTAKAGLDWKRILLGISLLVSLTGSFALLIFTFMINDALDKTESLCLQNIDGVVNDIRGIEGALTSAETEIGGMNATVSELQSSLLPLADGLEMTGNSTASIAASISSLPGIGANIPTSGLTDAAASLEEAGAKLKQSISGMDIHKQGIADLVEGVDSIKDSLKGQEATLAEARSSLEDVFGLVKIGNFLFFIVVLCVFTANGMNSIAGLL